MLRKKNSTLLEIELSNVYRLVTIINFLIRFELDFEYDFNLWAPIKNNQRF